MRRRWMFLSRSLSPELLAASVTKALALVRVY
jgi:hypothetical protein